MYEVSKDVSLYVLDDLLIIENEGKNAAYECSSEVFSIIKKIKENVPISIIRKQFGNFFTKTEFDELVTEIEKIGIITPQKK